MTGAPIPAEIDAYLRGLPAGSRAAVESIRETIRSVAPDATETVSYRMPAFKHRGRMLVWYAGFKEHASLFPANDAVRAALGDRLTPYLSGRGTIRFPLDEPIPSALVEDVVRARMREGA